jgi:hypothetical protein
MNARELRRKSGIAAILYSLHRRRQGQGDVGAGTAVRGRCVDYDALRCLHVKTERRVRKTRNAVLKSIAGMSFKLYLSTDENGPEIVDIGECRAGADQATDPIEEGVAVVQGKGPSRVAPRSAGIGQ